MRLFILLGVFGLSGCATGSYCTEKFDYQQAKSVAPLTSVEGLALPDSPSALRIPPAPEKSVAFGEVYKDAENDERVRCLDTPPPLPPVASPAPAPVPAPVAAPAPTSEEIPKN